MLVTDELTFNISLVSMAKGVCRYFKIVDPLTFYKMPKRHVITCISSNFRRFASEPVHVAWDSALVKPLDRSQELEPQKRARLLYQSRKRGMLENDLLLSTFAQRYLKEWKLQELEEYDKVY